MKNLTHKTIALALVASFSLCGAADVSAQAGTKSNTRVNWVGNSTIGLSFVGWARVMSTSSQSRVDTNMYTPLYFLGYRGTMHRLAVTSIRTDAGMTSSYSLQLAGVTRKSGSVAGAARRTFANHYNVFDRRPSETFWVGPVPLTVAGNIGFTGRMDHTFIDYGSSQRGCGLSGNTASYAYGYASLGIGIPGFQAGMSIELRLGEQKFNGFLGAWRNALSTRYHCYTLTPVRLLLKLFAEVLFWRGQLTVVNKSYGSVQACPFIN